MKIDHYIILAILSCVAIISAKTGKLTKAASITGWLIGLLVFAGSGYCGVAMLAAFFIMGTAATSWKMQVKQRMGFAEKDKGKRTAGQVLANAGVAGLLGVLIVLYPVQKDLFMLMTAGSFASAAADTLSSELGNVYGRKFYNILTLNKDTRGLDGVISIEGTVFGIAGSAVIALISSLTFGFNLSLLWIIVAGTIGNLSDSILGASLERKKILNNNLINFLNTFIGAFAAMVVCKLFN